MGTKSVRSIGKGFLNFREPTAQSARAAMPKVAGAAGPAVGDAGSGGYDSVRARNIAQNTQK